MMVKIKKTNLRTAGVILGIILIVAVISFVRLRPPSVDYSDFAQCLSDADATMYGTYWCSHCKAQKAEFGDAFQYVDYVECTEQVELCTENGVDGYPTWIIGGEKYTGKQSMEKLAGLTGCVLP